MALGYDGNVHLLSDADGDGVEDKATLWWDNAAGSVRGPIGMALTPQNYAHGNGLFVVCKGKLALLTDSDGDDRLDKETVVASGWQELPHGVDALGVAPDAVPHLVDGHRDGARAEDRHVRLLDRVEQALAERVAAAREQARVAELLGEAAEDRLHRGVAVDVDQFTCIGHGSTPFREEKTQHGGHVAAAKPGLARMARRGAGDAERAEYLEVIDRRCAHVRYWSEAEWRSGLARHGIEITRAVPYLSAAETQRWETLSRFTAGILYALAGGRLQPILDTIRRLNKEGVAVLLVDQGDRDDLAVGTGRDDTGAVVIQLQHGQRVVPLLTGAFGTYLVPLQIGAGDMAFPRLSASGYWLFFASGLLMTASFFVTGGAANSGWTSYPPLAVMARWATASSSLAIPRALKYRARGISVVPLAVVWPNRRSISRLWSSNLRSRSGGWLSRDAGL